MATKIDSIDLHAASGAALPTTFSHFASEAVVAVDESQRIVAFGGVAKY